MRRAIQGDPAQRRIGTMADGHAAARITETAQAARKASATAPLMRQSPAASNPKRDLVCASVTHSSSLRRVTKSRTSVRMIASAISHA